METKVANCDTPATQDRNSLSQASFPRIAAFILSASASLFSGCGPSSQAEWNEYAQKLPEVTPNEILEHPQDYMGKEVVISGSPEFVADHSYINLHSTKHGYDHLALSLEYKLTVSGTEQGSLPAWVIETYSLRSGNYTAADFGALSPQFKIAEKPSKLVGEVEHYKDSTAPYLKILHTLPE